LAKLRHYDDAIKDFTKVIEFDPKDARAYMARGTIYERMRLYAKALYDIEQALSLGDPRAADYIEEINQLIRRTSDSYPKPIRVLAKAGLDMEESHLEVIVGYESDTDDL
jgi:tetratricopeptide (TPR) repeat protein